MIEKFDCLWGRGVSFFEFESDYKSLCPKTLRNCRVIHIFCASFGQNCAFFLYISVQLSPTVVLRVVVEIYWEVFVSNFQIIYKLYNIKIAPNENFLSNFTFRKHLDVKNGNIVLFWLQCSTQIYTCYTMLLLWSIVVKYFLNVGTDEWRIKLH